MANSIGCFAQGGTGDIGAFEAASEVATPVPDPAQWLMGKNPLFDEETREDMFITIGAFTKVAVTDTAAAVALPGTSNKFMISGNTDMYLRFDGDTATTSAYDVFLPAGGMLLINAKSGLDGSVIQDSANGTLSVHEVI